MSERKVPKIRFPGFTDDWEQRKFGELCSIVTKQTGFDYTATIKNALVTEASEDTLPYLQTKNFEGVSISYDTDYYIPKKVAKEFPKINLDEKCLLFSIVGASVGNIGLFPGDKHCFLSGAICVSKLNNHDDADYLYHFMCSENGQSQIRTCTKGGAQATITIEDIREFSVLLPSEQERMKIGELLSLLDNLITLHQCECNKWKELKKGMLQKMFPKEGESVPEIRFPGFTDPWELRKSGDIAPLRGGFAFKSSEYCSDGVPIIRISNILLDGSVGAEFAYYNEQDSDEKYALYDGAAILAMSGATTGKVSVLHDEKGRKYYQNQRVGYFIPTDNCDYSFIRTIVRSQLFLDQLSAVLVAGAQPNVSSKEIDEFEYMIPKSDNEQRVIGECFENLDNLITLHQRECDSWLQLKKALLQQMFVA